MDLLDHPAQCPQGMLSVFISMATFHLCSHLFHTTLRSSHHTLSI